MIYSAEVQNMCSWLRVPTMAPLPFPRKRASGFRPREIKDISSFTHGIGWCAPQQGACKLTLNIKGGRH